MEPQPGFYKAVTDRVYRLKNAVDGLKESPRPWFDRFTKAMKKMGYCQTRGDHILFIEHLLRERLQYFWCMLMTL